FESDAVPWFNSYLTCRDDHGPVTMPCDKVHLGIKDSIPPLLQRKEPPLHRVNGLTGRSTPTRYASPPFRSLIKIQFSLNHLFPIRKQITGKPQNGDFDSPISINRNLHRRADDFESFSKWKTLKNRCEEDEEKKLVEGDLS
ncbi:hypothetical protein IGI04_038230, partial [Brassica rapa subsp. trilocularis]